MIELSQSEPLPEALNLEVTSYRDNIVEGEKEKKTEASRQPKGNVGKPDCKAEPSRATGLLKELQN